MSSDDGQPPAARLSEQTSVLFRAGASRGALTAGERRTLRQFAAVLSATLAGSAAFTCLISDDRELRRLNHAFLGHDYATDVLSFPAAAGNGNSSLGEIAISLERARAQAAALGHTPLDELRVLMLHGVLHLAGYDHERDRGRMARAERRYRASFGLPIGLIARARQSPPKGVRA